MMKFKTFIVTFLLTLSSYQPVQAAANNFTSKPIELGDNLLSLLRKNGLTEKEREKVLAADPGFRRLFLTLDTRYLVRKQGPELEMRFFDSQTSDAFQIIRKPGSLIARAYNPNYTVQHVSVEGQVYGSLLGSLLGKVKSNWVATRFIDAYAFELPNPREVSRGAPFAFTVEKKFVEGNFVKYGEIVRSSLQIRGENIKKEFIRHKGSGIFFSASDLLDNKPLYAPVEYLKIASRFKPNRLHPITKRLQPHLGIDFELPVGDPIFAPKKGAVLRYGHSRAAGYYIVLRHPNGLETYYNHLHKIDHRIRLGLAIGAGEKIGEIGCTGYCTRAHLHFAVKKQGRMVDPIQYIRPYPSHMESVLEKRVAQN